MRSAIATYKAPEGDSKVVEMGGVTFFDGQPVELNSEDHGHMIGKLQGNQHFDIDVSDDDAEAKEDVVAADEHKPRRGRPRKDEPRVGPEPAED